MARIFSLDATFRASPLLLYVAFTYTISRHSLFCKLDRVSYMVFDEADRMLALEMEVQLRHIVTCCSICVRQSVLFSATFPPAVERLVRSAVLDPV